MKRLVRSVAAILVLLVGSASAHEAAIQAKVRLNRCFTGGCVLVKQNWKASGVLVHVQGSTAYVMTAKHNVKPTREGPAPGFLSSVPHLWDSRSYVPGVIVAESPTHDLVITKHEIPAGRVPRSISRIASSVTIGEQVTLRSYRRGSPSEHSLNNGELISPDWISVRGSVVGGQSGGPVYNSAGDIVGILSCRAVNGSGKAWIVPASECRRLLSRCCQPAPVPQPIPIPVPEPTLNVVLDYDRLANEIIERMARDSRFRGREGPPGPAGSIDTHSHRITIKLAKDGQIVDTQVYDLDEPIILDFRKFMREQ